MSQASRSAYTAKIRDNILVIEDVGQGTAMSVTNNIEHVVPACLKSLGKTVDEVPYTVYRDSEGDWDGWDNVAEEFIHLLMVYDEDAAISELKSRI